MTYQKKKKMYTRDEVKAVATLWQDKTVDELARELKRTPQSITYIAHMIRKQGYNLARKRKTGTTMLMVHDVLVDEGLIDRNTPVQPTESTIKQPRQAFRTSKNQRTGTR